MNYGTIKKTDIANGIGVRVSLFVSGCTHHCKGCFNQEAWDFNYGKPFTKETEDEIIEALSHSYINGLTLLGGEPFEPANQQVLLPFIKRVKRMFPTKDIWCYTGYNFERDLLLDSRARCECTDEMLRNIDVIVDGKFIEKQKDITLQFRGSTNQRIINVAASIEEGNVQLLAL